MGQYIVLIVIAAIVFIFILIVSFFRRYKRCPSDRILVIYGKVGKGSEAESRSAKCIHGGAAFIWPIIQDYSFLDLTPFSIEINLTSALSKQNIRVDVPSRFTVGISTEPGIMINAAERLLGLSQVDISNLAKDIIFGQLRLVVATMDIEEINSNRDKFLAAVSSNVEAELKKIGLKLINVNVTDINDESGYIEALGKEAAAKAINDAKKTVAEKNRDGEIGQAIAHQEQRVKVADANADAKVGEAAANQKERISVAAAQAEAKIGEADANQKERVLVSQAVAQAKIGEAEAAKQERIKVAEADSVAVEGENTAKITIANSNALRREKEAEAERLAVAAEKVKQAKALEEAYSAEQVAEMARAERDRASQTADIVVPAQIDKEKVEIDAEAIAEQTRRRAKGDADAIFMKMQAEAKGIYEVLSKQAEGFEKLVNAAGNNPNSAVMLMIADKLPELVKTQVEAIKNLKIDKITVWDTMGSGKDGKSPTTANFLSGMLGSIPPFEELFKMAGMELPDYLKGTQKKEEKISDAEIIPEEKKSHKGSEK
ncbi:MAG: SPFH domain-containing protein [Bacteroidales bacterium]|jgi:flotillin|nr:SPFH domain-containing protein [Bacteroidales bacterium]